MYRFSYCRVVIPCCMHIFVLQRLETVWWFVQLERGSGIRVVLCWWVVTSTRIWHESMPVCSKTRRLTPIQALRQGWQILLIMLCRSWQARSVWIAALVTNELLVAPSTKSGRMEWFLVACSCTGKQPSFLFPLVGVSGLVVYCQTRNFQVTGSNLTAGHLQTTLGKLLTYGVLRSPSTQPPTLCRMGNE